MDFKIFKQHVKSNKLQPLYIFTGDEKTVMNKYLNLVPHTVVHDFFKLIPTFKMSLFSTGDHKVYVIKNSKELLSYSLKQILKPIPKGVTVILVYDKIDRRKKLFKGASKYIYEFNKIQNGHVYVKHLINLPQDMCQIIAQRCDHDIGRIESEVEKLKYLDTKITYDIINELIVPTPQDNVWEFVDAVMEKNPKKCYSIYGELKALNEDEIHFLGLLYQSFRNMLIVKGYISKSDKEISKLANMNYYQVKFARQAVNKYFSNIDISHILKYMQRIQQLEVDIKMGNIDAVMGFKHLINQFIGA